MEKGTATHLVIIISVALITAFAAHLFYEIAQPPTDRSFEIVAKKFSYEPHIIEVNKNDRVTITLAPEDVSHGLYIDAYEVETHAMPGEKSTIAFTATKTGKFPFRCSVTCGNFHPYMIGWLKVGPNYNIIVGLWLTVIAGWFALVAALKRAKVLAW